MTHDQVVDVEILLLSYYGKDAPPPTPPPLTREQELAAFTRYRKRKNAKDREILVRNYLVWSFGLAAKMKGPRLDFDTAISAANEGLVEALDRYDPSKGFRFTTLAAFYVHRKLVEAIISTYPVKVSDHIRKKWRGLKLSPHEMAMRLVNDEPRSLEEFFDRLGEFTEANISQLHTRPEDAPFVPGEGVNPADEFERSSLSIEVKAAVRKPNKLEREVILSRHYRDTVESYESIGKRLGVSKNSIRDCHDLCLVKLRRLLSE